VRKLHNEEYSSVLKQRERVMSITVFVEDSGICEMKALAKAVIVVLQMAETVKL
jgi:hypothetical protein